MNSTFTGLISLQIQGLLEALSVLSVLLQVHRKTYHSLEGKQTKIKCGWLYTETTVITTTNNYNEGMGGEGGGGGSNGNLYLIQCTLKNNINMVTVTAIKLMSSWTSIYF